VAAAQIRAIVSSAGGCDRAQGADADATERAGGDSPGETDPAGAPMGGNNERTVYIGAGSVGLGDRRAARSVADADADATEAARLRRAGESDPAGREQ